MSFDPPIRPFLDSNWVYLWGSGCHQPRRYMFCFCCAPPTLQVPLETLLEDAYFARACHGAVYKVRRLYGCAPMWAPPEMVDGVGLGGLTTLSLGIWARSPRARPKGRPGLRSAPQRASVWGCECAARGASKYLQHRK